MTDQFYEREFWQRANKWDRNADHNQRDLDDLRRIPRPSNYEQRRISALHELIEWQRENARLDRARALATMPLPDVPG